MSELSAATLIALSEWIDDSPLNLTRDPEAATWGRLSKITEEAGEVIAAWIGVTGQNPRKGVTHTVEDVRKELLDTALTALCAFVHLNNNQGDAEAALSAHILWVGERAGVGTRS